MCCENNVVNHRRSDESLDRLHLTADHTADHVRHNPGSLKAAILRVETRTFLVGDRSGGQLDDFFGNVGAAEPGLRVGDGTFSLGWTYWSRECRSSRSAA